MKKNILLHSDLSYIISSLGHGDKIVIGDAGLPVPKHISRIDLAVAKSMVPFFSVLDAVLSEMKIEGCVLANETRTNSELHDKIIDTIQSHDNKDIEFIYCSHENFKKICHEAVCAVRTGEFTPYCNIILSAGVVF